MPAITPRSISTRIPILLAGAIAACGGSSSDSGPTTAIISPLIVDASQVTGELRPLWRDHYDLSFEHFAYANEPGFSSVLADLEPRSWRCSVGRWEVGFPPPLGGDSTDPGVLGQIDREFYRGPNTLLGADDPLNYQFAYLDALLAGLIAEGLDPFLCFDYMPFSLALEQDPNNANNYNLSQPGSPYATYSFSNGIRTSPPADPAVYARVVRNTMLHVRGQFAGTTDFGVTWFEIGNEPDIIDSMNNPLPAFWTGNELQFFDMYAAIASEFDAHGFLTSNALLGAGSFAMLPSAQGTAFMQAFLGRVASQTPRIDYLSFHSYGDLPADHVAKFLLVQSFMSNNGLSLPWVNAEWGRALGGIDPVYDSIDHGIMRAQTLGFMQVFPFVLAHEALYRNPGTSPGELGLVRTNPAGHKPVSRMYQSLNRLNDTLQALEVSANPGSALIFPGANVAQSKVVLAVVLTEPNPGEQNVFQVRVDNLPWGNGAFRTKIYKVTEASTADGESLVLDETGTGGVYSTDVIVNAGDAGLVVIEIEQL